MLPELPLDDDGPLAMAAPNAKLAMGAACASLLQAASGRQAGIGEGTAPASRKRPLAGKMPASSSKLPRAEAKRAFPELPPDVDEDTFGDLPENILEDLTLDGPVEGPAGRPAKVMEKSAKVTFPGRSIHEVMQGLEMVPHRQAQLWHAQVPPTMYADVQDDLMEIYSPERMTVEARALGLRAELSIDLLTGWNLLDDEVRQRVVKEISCRRPRVLMMSPPCTWFSGLMNLNWSKIKPAVREQAMRDATLHLEFCMLLADIQESNHRGWAFEHPDSAKSWQNAKVKSWMHRGAFIARFDQCMFGLVSKVDGVRMKKRTRFMTNIKQLYDAFDKKVCDKTHEHVAVQGSEGGEKRSVWAQRYPQGLCETAVRAFASFVGKG
jgi:hypothetical protein